MYIGSVAGWVRLDYSLDDVLDVTAFSIGSASLKFAAPAVPYLAVEEAWPDLRRHFDYQPNRRCRCADRTLKISHTPSFQSALRQCVQLPGCTVVVRNSQSQMTFFCLAAYTISESDAAWFSASLRDPPPIHRYAGAVTADSWNYFVLTYSSGKANLYVNGALRQTAEVSPLADFSPLHLGRSPRWFEGRFPGQVGNVRVWPRQLEPHEVVMSMSPELPITGHVLNVNATPRWAWPAAGKSAWTKPAVPGQLSQCDAAVVLPMVDRTNLAQVQILASHLQRYTGGSCHAKVFLVDCSGQDLAPDSTSLTEPVAGTLATLHPAGELHWDACVRFGLQQVLERDPETPYVAVVVESLRPLYGWLSGLVNGLHQHTDAAAVFAKVLFANGTIKSSGSRFEKVFDDYLGRQVVQPVAMYAGYPWSYRPAMKPAEIRAADCSAWVMRASAARSLLENGGFSVELGSSLACSDMALRLYRYGRHAVLVSPASIFIETATESRQDPAALQAFDELWGRDLAAQYASDLASNATVSWVMQCGGSDGAKAYNLVQHLEGRLQLRAQIQRGWPFCEHPDVLQAAPLSFSRRVHRLRGLSAYLPSDIIIHQKDYRQLAAWPWPPNNSSSYLIGRYSWDLDRVNRQWANQMKNELDEVWVPSNWHAAILESQGVRADKIFVIPDSVDSWMYDPDIWEPVTLPRQRRVAFLASFRLDDYTGWQAVLSAYLKAFRNRTADVSLYVHTAMLPEMTYRKDYIYDAMNTFLLSSGDPYLQSISLDADPRDDSAPHVHVLGRQLLQDELLRICSSVDVLVVPLRSEGWDVPYLEAMSLGKPIISATWGGLAEYIQPDFAFQVNHTMVPVHTSDKGLRGSNWAKPNVDDLTAAFLAAYRSRSLRAIGNKARLRVVERYDNKIVSNMVLERLREIGESELKLASPRAPKSLDMAKDPIPVDVHMCGAFPKASPRAKQSKPALKVAVVSTALPRRCGIATFNAALLEHLQPLLPKESSVEILPLVWDAEIPATRGPEQSTRFIRQENYGDYISAAHYVNSEGFHAVILQHEFGIWGGTVGSLVVCFAKMLEVPVISVIHTLSDNLGNPQQYILQHLSAASTNVVVMSESSRNKLGALHGIPGANVVVLPHGAPLMTAVDPLAAKSVLNLTGKTVLLTNGLLSPGKGIHLVLHALPEIVKDFPNVVYLIVGEPHPDCGQPCTDYYARLVKDASDPRILDNVRFVSKFLENELLLRYVQAADIFVLPYTERITTNSGTLTMAMAAGKAVVSTAFDHAASALVGRGILVEFESSPALREGILKLLRDEKLRVKFQSAAKDYSYGRDWRSVARGYVSLLQNVTAA
ncbi:hypothetical protein VOLCADRAFT_87288 [Volvox carteri f. nagariensis]|uniref:Glycosyl transferase family 1 domain-containing protein n=1 Tax=Volvox carteri f. nagariensis TaxID=3068 RepID=D8TKY2_VOLCA|nr:uncharacterized protein VOLCADRAFT_87288 [Volvox carteri f. nagariensis]EFJ51775.1 hypothetical protein VOLCADRAFT_87288 [Volvox carteri f. nagariensis]|eukprot:XP_002947185.1 hypothetical protein VOLCADRAFT_87288 [Volvox carteri f. nagariensis]